MRPCLTRFRPLLFALAAGCCFLSGCATFKGWFRPGDRLALRQTTFAALPGWNADDQSKAAVALQRSCGQMMLKPPAAAFDVGGRTGTMAEWQAVCTALAAAPPQDGAAARKFFEAHFTPYVMSGNAGTQGLFTGYYEPTLHGSTRRHGKYIVPIYGRPENLVTVDLGVFNPALKGEHIVGRVDKGKALVPYYDRAAIDRGALKGVGETIVWVNNAVDAFFLHIQGSGRIVMSDGKVLRVGYAAQNGLPYVAIGRAMVERGYLDKSNVSMQSIRAWLEGHPKQAAQVMDINESYIFFRKLGRATGPLDGPLGAEGVPLVPRRSLAVDHSLIPYGVPVWIDAANPSGGDDLQRLMVAQDTGGAITGAVRGDFFWGAGKEATEMAGLMDSKGRAWMLLPKPEEKPSVWRKRLEGWWRGLARALHLRGGNDGQ
ncbi:MAG: MltA domain-containing protein [Alphaproteobacteria bacterium]|nr:MltA domain-containing protein [Alphaproteobacteria bacterium]